MDHDALGVYKWATPFRPFRLVSRDGRVFDITHPNQIWPGRDAVLIGLPPDSSHPDRFGTWVSLPADGIDRDEFLGATAEGNTGSPPV